MEMDMQERTETDRPIWFSMWFLGAIATFGIAFFPMFYRLVDNRNKHFRREADLEKHISTALRERGKETPPLSDDFHEMNAKAWATAIIFVIPAFVLTYILSVDLARHEKHQDIFLANTLPERVFMPQALPIKKYVLITIVTLGVGIVYWLYKIINMYNAHFKAQWSIEKELGKLMEG
jgi:hypothetical protein